MVMSYSGYDIEDAIVLNRASLDRGFGRCNLSKRYTTTIKQFDDIGNERIVAPPDTGIVKSQYQVNNNNNNIKIIIILIKII